MVEVAKAVRSQLMSAALAAVRAAKQLAEKVPDSETTLGMVRSGRGALVDAADRLKQLKAFQLEEKQQSVEELLSSCKRRLQLLLEEILRLPACTAGVVLLLAARTALVAWRLAPAQVLRGHVFRSRLVRCVAAAPCVLMIQQHRSLLLQDLEAPLRSWRFSEAMGQLAKNTQPFPPLFWASFAILGLEVQQVSEVLLHRFWRFKRLVLASALLALLARKMPLQQLREKSPAAQEVLVSLSRGTWSLLKDLALHVKSLTTRPPPRIPPGTNLGSPTSEEQVVSEIQEPPVFGGS